MKQKHQKQQEAAERKHQKQQEAAKQKLRKDMEKAITSEKKRHEREVKKLEKAKAQEAKQHKRKLKTRQVLGHKLKKIYGQNKRLRPQLINDSFRKNTSKWSISGWRFKDPITFLRKTAPWVRRLIDSIDGEGKKVYTILMTEMIRSDSETGEDTIIESPFRSNTHTIINEEDTNAEYGIMRPKMLNGGASS